MSDNRLEDERLRLHALFKELIGSTNVYFQPPTNVVMKYPAIRYSRENIENSFADNKVYGQQHVYNVTVIDSDPDSIIVDKISKLPTCRFNRHYSADNLNHDVFILYYH